MALDKVYKTLGSSNHTDHEREENNYYDLYDIPRYRGRLKINKNGDIYSLITNKFLKKSTLPSGYETLILTVGKKKTKTEYLHRLLMETFSNEPQKETVNHKNGIKNDNRLENLEWATQSENNKHAIDNNLKKINVRGFYEFREKRRVLSDDEILFIKKNKNLSVKEISNILKNDHLYAIFDAKNDRSWKDVK